MGRNFDPEFFDLHELQNRVEDFQRVIGEVRWGFYRRNVWVVFTEIISRLPEAFL